MSKSFLHWIGAILSFFIVLSGTEVSAQIEPPIPNQFQSPVKWSYSVKRISDEEADLIFKADIGPEWHLYSQNIGEGGPVPTSFKFNQTADFARLGKTKESKAIKKEDPVFNMTVAWFEKSATFTQRICIRSGKAFKIKGELEYMVCNDKNCLPPDYVDFEFAIEASPTLDEKIKNGTAGSCNAAPSGATGATGATGVTGSTGSTGASIDTAKKDTSNSAGAKIDTLSSSKDTTGTTVKGGNGTDDPKGPKRSLWATFLLCFFGGFAAILMPCIFPMIPLTVSFFTKQSKNKKKGVFNATMYGIFIIGIYVSLGLLITIIFGEEALNKIASNEWMNLIFFIIFIIFGISFLGAFEITLPSSWINKADAASEKGGMIGIFFMAFTLSLVSFSCTGPIIGSLLVEASQGGRLGPAIGMFGFSLALALPFTLFAAFPGWLNSLPKSGGWMNSVKIVLGLLEIAFALKFLSVTDLQGLHIDWLDFHIDGPLGILKREVFIALWIVIFALIGFYLLGKIKFSHDSESSHVSVPGVLMAIVSLGFVVYLIPGMFGAPLKLISGFPPPSFYTEGWNAGAVGEGGGTLAPAPKDSTVLSTPAKAHCPHNIACFNDYYDALAYAKQVGKPLMIDFTGIACVNCRRMEENVWSDPAVLSRIKNDYVLVSLYVDESTPLPADQHGVSKRTGRKVRTKGNKWAEFQAERYGSIAQPLYALVDHEEKDLVAPRDYDEDIPAYIKFLDDGKAEFKKRMGAKKGSAH